MEPRIEVLGATKLIGRRTRMSFAVNRTKELWQSFMPKRPQIKNCVGSAFYSVEIYHDPFFFKNFDPSKEFEKWAAIQVADFNTIPDEMEALCIPQGLYAVFLYKGRASEAQAMYQYIYGRWIPNAGYTLDNRPHFALMGEKYKNDDPDSEEELWIPVMEIKESE